MNNTTKSGEALRERFFDFCAEWADKLESEVLPIAVGDFKHRVNECVKCSRNALEHRDYEDVRRCCGLIAELLGEVSREAGRLLTEMGEE